MTQHSPTPSLRGTAASVGAGAHVRPSDLRGCVELSADFICAMVNYGQHQQAPVEPAKKKHASGPVKARATDMKRVKK